MRRYVRRLMLVIIILGLVTESAQALGVCYCLVPYTYVTYQCKRGLFGVKVRPVYVTVYYWQQFPPCYCDRLCYSLPPGQACRHGHIPPQPYPGGYQAQPGVYPSPQTQPPGVPPQHAHH
jgi:hypothetical protein